MPTFSTPYDPPIPATDIHDGSVSNAEFGYLNGVTSAIQTQIDGKAATSHGHAISDVTGLQTALDGKSSTSHNHSGVYEAAGAVSTHAAVTSGVHGISSFAATILDDADAAMVRGTIGLGSIATQSAGSVAITGGTISGITDLAIADGGTGASSASAARANLSVYSEADTDQAIAETVAGLQPLDATLTALAGWTWSSGVEVATLTAADTRGVLRVGTGANELVQLTSDGKLPAVDGSLLTGIAGGASNLDGLSDVTITAAASGDFLRHNGTAWVDATISASDLPSGIDRTKIGNGIDVVETFFYKQSSNVDYNGTSGTFSIEPADLQITVPSTGLWQITALVNIQKASTGASTAIRLAMGTAVVSGTTGWPAGGHFSAGATANCTITTGSPTIVSGASRSPGSNDICFAITWNLNVTTAGTIKVQMSDGSATANIFKLLNTSTIIGKRLAA